jgi:hypothetical protein
MAFVLPDRTRETLASAPGTGNATTAGATQGAQSIASSLTSNGDTTWATIDNGTAWETNTITRVSAGVYSRGTPFASSNAGALVNFESGTLEIFPDLPGIKAKILERLAWATAAITPPTNDGTALGTGALAFSDLFLATGGVLNFNNGNYTITHSTGKLTFSGNLDVITISSLGQATTTPTTASGVQLYLQDSGGSGNDGGMVAFGAGQGYFAGIKGALTDGSNNTLGSLGFYTRVGSSDSTLTRAAVIFATGGVNIGAPTGGDKGAGTLNATAVYDDNVLLTCYVLQAFMEGKIDTAYWDDQVVDYVTPERVETRDVTESQHVERVDLILSEDGSHYVAQKSVADVQVPVKVWVPIYDEKGNGIDAREEIVTETTTIPATEEERSHVPARAFADRLDELDPDVFVQKWKKTGVLPGLPSPEEFAAKPPSTGEMIQKLWELCELQAVHIAVLSQRIAAK